MNKQPVLLAIIVALLTEAGATATLLAQDHTTAGIIVAVGGILTAIAGAIARTMVTPLAEPKTNEGTPLVPVRAGAEKVFVEPTEPSYRPGAHNP